MRDEIPTLDKVILAFGLLVTLAVALLPALLIGG
jgi:hypothetical protein